MAVPLLDLKLQYATIREEVRQAVDEVLDSQRCLAGPHRPKLEASLAAYCGCTHGLGVASGTDALLCALMAMDVAAGDEVITTAFTFFATCGAVARVGARPVFVDIEPDTFNMDPAAVERAITPRTKAIIPVHLFGQCADMTAIMAIAKKHGLEVLEDAAQAIGAKHRGQPACSFGRAGCLSFYPTKNLGAMGDAGMIVSTDAEFLLKCGVIRVHGDTGGYTHVRMGGNFRMDELQAAALNVKFKHLDSWTTARRANATQYNELLCGISGVVTPVIRPENQSVYNQYVIRAQRRNELKAFLAGRKIDSAIYYPTGLHVQKVFEYLGYKMGDFPQTNRAADEVLALPIFPELKPEQIREVAGAIREFYQKQ